MDGERERAGVGAGGKRGEPGGETGGEPNGEVTGALTSAGLESATEPIARILDDLSASLGGWWASDAVGRDLERWTDEEERMAGSHYDSMNDPDVDPEAARTAYVIGFMAADNPDYDVYTAVDDDFGRHWAWDEYEYEELRPYVRAGYERHRSGPVT